MAEPWSDFDLWKLKSLIEIGKSASEAGKLLGRTKEQARAAAKKHGYGSFKGKPGASYIRPMPEGFADDASLTYRELQAKYRCTSHSIKKWLKECGISKKPPPREKPKRSTTSRADKHFWPVERHQRDDSELGEAVSYLRQFGPVIRSGTDGRYNERGTMWRRGNTLLTADEILERAASNKRRERR